MQKNEREREIINILKDKNGFITVKELCNALNRGLRLEERNIDISNYYIKTFNPLSFIKGRDVLKDYGIRNGTIIELV